jgi:hypothetical protein
VLLPLLGEGCFAAAGEADEEVAAGWGFCVHGRSVGGCYGGSGLFYARDADGSLAS